MSLCECGCGRPTVISPVTDRWHGWAKGEPRRFLAGHNNRLRRIIPVEEDRGFTTPCLIWGGSLNHAGYGRRRSSQAHRMAWEEANGPVPDGLYIDHLCRVRACVRVDHMELVTHAENVRRGSVARAAAAPTDPNGLRALRVAHGLTQKRLAEIVGVSPGTISNWELGIHAPAGPGADRLRDLSHGAEPDQPAYPHGVAA